MNTMGSNFHFREKIRVGVLGATGTVGQRFVQLLSSHPWFELVALAASERSAGKLYKDAVNWLMPTPIPESIANKTVLPCEPNLECNIVFSGLDSNIAGERESAFAEAGYIVISNSKNHRMDPDVPLLVPEINPNHTKLITFQKTKGKIITNPNCSVTGLVMALKPLLDRFGLEAVNVVTMQAISGAGYPGVASMDIVDNVVPFINDEEQKIESEPFKIFGELTDDAIKTVSFPISAQCNRVPVTDGHMECVSVKLKRKAAKEDIIEAWNAYKSDPQRMQLPMAPDQPIYYFEEERWPQPKLHRHLDKGMAVSIGRLRECPLLDYKFVFLSHNTIRGAAGGAILNAELLVNQGFVFW